MYKRNLETMPREIKEEIVLVASDVYSVDDLISLEENTSLKSKINQICCFSQNLFPDFWLVTLNLINSEKDMFYIVFETKLTEYQEKIFFEAMKSNSLQDEIGFSFSDKYGIY